jgi:uncharacterized SAM-binding protein YcdF (DUF218 family)
MSVRALLTTLLLPPLLLVLVALLGTLSAWRGRRGAGLAAAALLALLALATPAVADWLRLSLERRIPPPPPETAAAIVVLSADVAHRRDGIEVGPLTLERMRAGAAVHRNTGLPLLVTGGVISARQPISVAELMQATYAGDFALAVRWVETAARDTRDNAELSARLLRAEGIAAVWLVSHSWHLPRAARAFARAGLAVHPAPVRLVGDRDIALTDWIPTPRAMLDSWYYLREWAGILAYWVRDG